MAEVQHYVPRFVLKNFSRGKTPQLYVYDKATDKRFRSNIRGVASEAGFYDLDVSGVTLSMEPALLAWKHPPPRRYARSLRTEALRVLNFTTITF